jgi:drug/metabolite transporter (DMT)-like permease
MLWLTVALLSYFLLALVNIIDKHLLKSRIPNPKVYAFYVGALGIFVLLLAPFGFLEIPSLSILLLALLAGVFHILAIWALFSGLKNFEASRIVPAVGALLPIFTFGFIFLAGGGEKVLGFREIAAFFLLVSGTVLITYQGKSLVSAKSLKIAAVSAFFFAAFFIAIKFVYISHPFVSGIIWSRVGAFLAAIFLVFSKEVRNDILGGTKIVEEKTWLILIPNQLLGSAAMVLQNWAIALAPFAYLGIINALEGTKYFFLLFFAAVISIKYPQILKEEVFGKVLFQKISAIVLMGAGLVILFL